MTDNVIPICDTKNIPNETNIINKGENFHKKYSQEITPKNNMDIIQCIFTGSSKKQQNHTEVFNSNYIQVMIILSTKADKHM